MSDERHDAPPPPPQQRLKTSTETPVQDFERQKAVIEREQAATRLLDELTELAKIGRQFLEETINAELAAQEAERRRREERLARARHR